MWKPEHRRAAERNDVRYPSDLTDAEWALVEPMIPPGRHGGRKRSVNVREVLNERPSSSRPWPRVLRDPHCRLRQSIWCDEQSRRFDALHHIKVEHRRLEIGVTWIGTAFQRTHINTEAKLLQLWYAFDVLKCRRIELKADVDNEKSRTAILRLGAVQEGIFRKHMIYADGRNRDNVYFSIVDDEWPQVRASLEDKLGYPVTPAFGEAPAS